MNNLNQIKEAAQHLARIHKIDIGEKKDKLFIFEEWKLGDREKDLNKLKRIIERYVDKCLSIDMIKRYSELLYSKHLEFYFKKEFCSCIIHGDFHGGNLFFRGNDLVSIIDWDTARINPRVYDFAKAMYLLTRNEHGSFNNDINKMRVFYESYTNINSLSYEELKAAICFLELSYIPKIKYIRSFGSDTSKIQWYLGWTYNATMMVEKQFKEKYLMII